MALVVYDWTRCHLCEAVLREDDDILGFPDYVGWSFSELADNAVHRACFIAWEYKEAFVRSFNDTKPYFHLKQDGEYEQVANPARLT